MPPPKDPIKYEAYCRGQSRKGIENPNYGNRWSEEQKSRASERAKERYKDPEYRKKQSESKKRLWADPIYREKVKGTHKHSEETKQKFRIIRKGISTHPQTEESRTKISIAQKKKWEDPIYRKSREWVNKGPNNASWKGGISFEPYCIKFNNEFKERVRAFFNYQCVECGSKQNGELLHIHHVNFNKQSCCDKSIPLFVALCKSCHGKTGHNREEWREHFTEILTTFYGGKCYLTKEEMEGLKS